MTEERKRKMAEYSYLFLIAGVILASFSQVLLKKSAGKQYSVWWREYVNLLVITGYGMLFGSTFFNVLGLRKLEYMDGPVVESLGYVLVPVLSYFFFREKITLRKLAGVACIVAGMLVFYM